MINLLKLVKVLSTGKLIKYVLLILIISIFLFCIQFYRKIFFTKKNSRQFILNSKIPIEEGLTDFAHYEFVFLDKIFKEKRLKLFLFSSILLTFGLANFIFLFPFRDITLLILISNALLLAFAVWRFINFGGHKMFLLSLLSEVCIVTRFFVYLHDYFFDAKKTIYFIINLVLCIAAYFISKDNTNHGL